MLINFESGTQAFDITYIYPTVTVVTIPQNIHCILITIR